MQRQHYKLFEDIMEENNITHALMTEWGAIPRRYGLDILYEREVHTLQYIGRYPGVTVTELAEEFSYTNSACSQTVKKLREKGLLIQEKNSRDKREYNLYLTDRGRQVYEFHEQYDKICREEIYQELLEFTDEEYETYLRIQKAFNKKLVYDVRRSKRRDIINVDDL